MIPNHGNKPATPTTPRAMAEKFSHEEPSCKDCIMVLAQAALQHIKECPLSMSDGEVLDDITLFLKTQIKQLET